MGQTASVGIASPRSLKPLLLLETSTMLSGAGNGAALVVLPWLVLERTGSPGAAGVLAAATAAPRLVSSVVSGAVVDSMGRRRTAVAADGLSAASVIALPVVDLLLGLNLAWLVGLAILGSVFDPAGVNARETMLPAAAGRAGWTLDRVNGVHEAIWGVAFLLGPGAGGLLISWIGAVDALWVTAGCFVVSGALVAFVTLPHTGRPPGAVGAGRIWRETLDGLRFVRHEPLLLAVAGVTALVLAVYMPIEEVLLPVHFESLDQPGRLGLALMALSGGGIVGALAHGAFAGRVPRSSVFRWSLLLGAIGVLGMAMLPPFPALIGLSFATGFVYGPIGPLVNLAMQTRSPEHMRGRVAGVMTATEYAAGPFAFLLVGAATEQFGVGSTFASIGLASLGIAALGFAVTTLRQLDHADPLVHPHH